METPKAKTEEQVLDNKIETQLMFFGPACS